MNVWIDQKTGRRDRSFRPTIEDEWQANSVYLYDPNGSGFNYGLYQGAQPSCGSWVGQIWDQFPSRVPMEVVDKTGRLHLVRPTWWKYGYKFEPMLKHTYSE